MYLTVISFPYSVNFVLTTNMWGQCFQSKVAVSKTCQCAGFSLVNLICAWYYVTPHDLQMDKSTFIHILLEVVTFTTHR